MGTPLANPEIVVYPDHRDVARAAASLIARLSASVVAESPPDGRFSIAVSGGTTPQLLYETLAAEPYASTVQWQNWDVWWGDERAVPSSSPESNYHLVKDSLLSAVPIPSQNIHRIRGESDPQAAAWQYESDLKKGLGAQAPRMDLILLGLGTDGHTASLMPGSPALEESRRWVVPSEARMPPARRVTLTLPVINAARHIVFIVTGREKAEALRAVVAADAEDAHVPPAALIQPADGTLYWFVDEAAASHLTGVPAR